RLQPRGHPYDFHNKSTILIIMYARQFFQSLTRKNLFLAGCTTECAKFWHLSAVLPGAPAENKAAAKWMDGDPGRRKNRRRFDAGENHFLRLARRAGMSQPSPLRRVRESVRVRAGFQRGCQKSGEK